MLLLVKFRNCAGLFWESLDDGERRIVVYAACYVVAAGLAALQRGSRERLKREIRDELIAGAMVEHGRPG